MSVPSLATIADLTARMGDVGDVSRAMARLADASALIRAEASPEDWLTVDGLLESVPPLIVTICCGVAQRVLDNPAGLSAESLGTYSATIANSSTDVYLTKAERRLVRKVAGALTIGSIEFQTPYRKEDVADIYMTVADSDEQLPMGPWPQPAE